MEAVWLLLDGGAPPSSTRFGFSWNGPFRCENPRFWGLEKLGFPWIFSTESRLINGLHEIFSGSFFPRVFVVAKEPSKRRPTIRHAEGMDCSWDKLSLISDFLQDIAAQQKLSPEPFPSDRLHPKANRSKAPRLSRPSSQATGSYRNPSTAFSIRPIVGVRKCVGSNSVPLPASFSMSAVRVLRARLGSVSAFVDMVGKRN
jgi:hypothetical protein